MLRTCPSARPNSDPARRSPIRPALAQVGFPPYATQFFVFYCAMSLFLVRGQARGAARGRSGTTNLHESRCSRPPPCSHSDLL